MPRILPKSQRGKSVSIRSDELEIDLDAAEVARTSAEVIAEAHRTRIPKGIKADGSGSNRGSRGGRDGVVGYETGRLAKSIRARVSGGEHQARAQVAPRGLDDQRERWLERNADEILFAPEEGTPLSDEVDAALDLWLDRAIK